MKLKTVRGAGAKAKGSRAERQWRDELKRIYKDAKLHDKIKRVPMSGASWMKGDVVDLNDYDTLYEVKNQETLSIPDWWRQTKREAGASRTPVLVITQNHRPFYVFLEETALNAMMLAAGVNNMGHVTHWRRQKGLLDAIDGINQYDYVLADVGAKDNIVLAAIKGESYIQLKKMLTNNER